MVDVKSQPTAARQADRLGPIQDWEMPVRPGLGCRPSETDILAQPRYAGGTGRLTEAGARWPSQICSELGLDRTQARWRAPRPAMKMDLGPGRPGQPILRPGSGLFGLGGT